LPEKALITGITGQTGAYLARHLLQEGCEVHGTTRSVDSKAWRLEYLGISNEVKLHALKDTTLEAVNAIIVNNFDCVFHLAAESSVGNSLKHPTQTVVANVVQTTALLEAIKTHAPDTRFFNAVSSEVLEATDKPLTENSKRSATNPYAVTKLAAMNMAKVFRESFGLYIVNGILFNHESELRDTRFVTAKIIHNLCRLLQDETLAAFQLGNVESERDFSHAEDFARGITASLEHTTSQDYVFASGKLHSVKDFFDAAAHQLGFQPDWQGKELDMVCRDAKTGRVLVTINPEFYRPIDEKGKIGNAARARRDLDWQPQTSFENLVKRMIAFHMDRS